MRHSVALLDAALWMRAVRHWVGVSAAYATDVAFGGLRCHPTGGPREHGAGSHSDLFSGSDGDGADCSGGRGDGRVGVLHRLRTATLGGHATQRCATATSSTATSGTPGRLLLLLLHS